MKEWVKQEDFTTSPKEVKAKVVNQSRHTKSNAWALCKREWSKLVNTDMFLRRADGKPGRPKLEMKCISIRKLLKHE